MRSNAGKSTGLWVRPRERLANAVSRLAKAIELAGGDDVVCEDEVAAGRDRDVGDGNPIRRGDVGGTLQSQVAAVGGPGDNNPARGSGSDSQRDRAIKPVHAQH